MCIMKKIAILTRTSTINFGTILQNYALQYTIKNLGYYVRTIDDTIPRRIISDSSNTQNTENYNPITKAKIFIYNKFDLLKEIKHNKRYYKTLKKCNRFKKNKIRYYKVKSFEQLNCAFDTFISGSDQIWSDKAEPYLFPFFMQDFVSDDKVKASYSVSVGAYFEEKNKSIVSSCLNRMNYISVREKSSYNIINELVNKDINIVCDPVLLIDKLHWEELAGRRKIKQKYIFAYFLSDNDWYYKKLNDFPEKSHTDSVFLYESIKTNHSEYSKIEICSPADFLNYILYADFVITDSFHAVMFSLIFQKQFYVFERYSDKINYHQNGRLQEILQLTDLSSRLICQDNSFDNSTIDYKGVSKKLDDLKDYSLDYLKRIIK